jgi:hypothetical protein
LYLLASPSRLDPLRRDPRRLGPAAGKTLPAARPRLGGGLRGRLVLAGKKGGADVGRGHKGNGTNYLVLTDGNDTPLSAIITAANVSEVHAIETLVEECSAAHRPERLLYD